jgi:hypothetical protein
MESLIEALVPGQSISPAQPMLVLLKMEAGKIAAQYTFMLTGGSLLQQ